MTPEPSPRSSLLATRASLLTRLRDLGDESAWREFDRQYRNLVVGYCRQRGLQEADAEDVRQIVMMHLARAFPRFHYDAARGRFRNYLRTVILNAIRNHRRPNQESVPLDSDVEPPQDETADHAWEQEWMLHHYRMAMIKIRESFEAKSLQVFDDLLGGLSVSEAATKHALSDQAVYKIKQRVRHRLSELIAEQVQEEDAHGA